MPSAFSTLLPVLTVKSAPFTAEKTETQRSSMTAKVSHHITPLHGMVQKRVQRPRFLLRDLVPSAICSDLRYRVCTKGPWSPASAVESRRFRGPVLPRPWGLLQIQDITLPLLPITQEKGPNYWLPGGKNKATFFSKYLSLFQGCCWVWPLAREKLLGWGVGRSPGLKTECPWA